MSRSGSGDSCRRPRAGSVTYVPVTPDRFQEGARRRACLLRGFADALGRLNDTFAAERAAGGSDDIERVLQPPPRNFDQFAQDHAQAFRG
ncbi:MAG: hypothetical protein ACRD9R_15095 [Pyrinomonadaceae bacterium]